MVGLNSFTRSQNMYEKISFGERTGDGIEFEYESPDEIYLTVNDSHPSVLCRDDVVELIGFLSQFVDGEI